MLHCVTAFTCFCPFYAIPTFLQFVENYFYTLHTLDDFSYCFCRIYCSTFTFCELQCLKNVTLPFKFCEGPSVGPSYSSAEEFLERSQPGPVPFEPEDSNTVVAEAFETQVDIRGDPDPLKSEDATTEHEENVAG